MDSEAVPSSRNLVKCCNCECSCSLATDSSGTWLRSVKRKHGEFEGDNKFSVPELDTFSVARVQIENECEALREIVASQQQAIQDLHAELEEERNASTTAANEAMSMILRLQREKAEIQMEARQFKRFAEEKTSHDQQELLALEDMVYKREQTIQALTCEVQAYKHRMMSYGLTESEAEGERNLSLEEFDDQYELPTYDYPPLKCSGHITMDADNDDTDIEKYAFGETPCDRLRNLENRISQMERNSSHNQVDGDYMGKNILEKVVVGQSPRHTRHSRKLSNDSSSFVGMGREMGPDFLIDSPKSFRKMDYVSQSEEHSNLRKVDYASEAADDMSDRVYTIDSVHTGTPYQGLRESKAGAVNTDYTTTPTDFEDPDIKKLYMRLQALEADRESMRQAIISMRTDKAQVVLLKEIAQHLCKEMSPQKKMTVRKPSAGRFSFLSIIKVYVWDASQSCGLTNASGQGFPCKATEMCLKHTSGRLCIEFLWSSPVHDTVVRFLLTDYAVLFFSLVHNYFDWWASPIFMSVSVLIIGTERLTKVYGKPNLLLLSGLNNVVMAEPWSIDYRLASVKNHKSFIQMTRAND
ncbi:myosin-binding protein 7 [Senna tora]|uniref:Myosin-binding protein 7 n=1 Tax=Senna tora TaxID=362788 RepID=A0A834TCR9_9FABA|nr:myosin-binding protein 7 [Senna tora]